MTDLYLSRCCILKTYESFTLQTLKPYNIIGIDRFSSILYLLLSRLVCKSLLHCYVKIIYFVVKYLIIFNSFNLF